MVPKHTITGLFVPPDDKEAHVDGCTYGICVVLRKRCNLFSPIRQLNDKIIWQQCGSVVSNCSAPGFRGAQQQTIGAAEITAIIVAYEFLKNLGNQFGGLTCSTAIFYDSVFAGNCLQ
eukprot:12427094-Karenia_brevis.AAC.1